MKLAKVSLLGFGLLLVFAVAHIRKGDGNNCYRRFTRYGASGYRPERS
jgi:hypothetical protein